MWFHFVEFLHNFVHFPQICITDFLLQRGKLCRWGRNDLFWGFRVEGRISPERWSFRPCSPVPPPYGFISAFIETTFSFNISISHCGHFYQWCIPRMHALYKPVYVLCHTWSRLCLYGPFTWSDVFGYNFVEVFGVCLVEVCFVLFAHYHE